MSSSRMTKKELRHDAFVDATARATAYVQKNFMTLLVVIAALGVAIVVGVFIQQSRQISKVQASRSLFRVTTAYSQGQYSDALLQMDELISRFGDTAEGKAALYLAGASHLALGENDEAVARFESYLQESSTGQYATSAKLGLGLAEESRGDLQAAVTRFRGAAEGLESTDPSFVQAALGEARALQSLGRIDEAIAALEPLIDVDDFTARQEVESRRSTLEALR